LSPENLTHLQTFGALKQSRERLAAINAYGATSHRATRDPSNAHRRQWAPDDGFSSRDQAVNTGDCKPLAKFRCANGGDRREQHDTKAFRRPH
jgi:hypothetical protein